VSAARQFLIDEGVSRNCLLYYGVNPRGSAPEVCQREGLRLGATPLAGVEGVDGSDFLGGEFEVEHVDVLSDPLRFGRLRDDLAALLQMPAQHDLGGSLVVGLGDVADDRILKGAVVLPVTVKGDAADRGPGLGQQAWVKMSCSAPKARTSRC
jgi:hypothetical protein